jgi:hypothetical protein
MCRNEFGKPSSHRLRIEGTQVLRRFHIREIFPAPTASQRVGVYRRFKKAERNSLLTNFLRHHMLAVSLASATWFGYETVTFFTHKHWSFLLRLFSGYPIGIIYQSFTALVLQYYMPWGNAHLAAVLAVLGVPSAVFYCINARARVRNRIQIRVMDVIFLTIAAAFIVTRLSLVYFKDGEKTRGACYSDFSFHLGLISSIAIGCNVNRSGLFRFETVISAGSPLAYPIFVNFHAAFLFVDCNVTFPDSMKWTAFLIGICFVFLIYSLTLQFTNGDSWAAALSLPLWGFTGGLGFLEVFDFGLKSTNSGTNYIHDFNQHKKAFWFQSLTHVFHPQRSATFAMPLCYITINALLCGVQQFDWRFFLLAALVVGVTPQTQVHAFAALAFFSLALAAVTFPFDGRFRRASLCWALFGLVANAIALPLWLPFAGRASSSNEFLSYKPIWTNPNYARIGGFFSLWWKSLGVFGLISLVFGYAVADAPQIRVYSAAMAVFFVASTVMFQPWELDNCKIFQDGWLPLAVGFVSQYFTRIWRQTSSFVIRTFLLILFFCCLGSGFLNLLFYEGYSGYLYGIGESQTGNWVAENSPVHSIFHATIEHVLVPCAAYAGRPLFQGYGGWTLSHGLLNSSRSVLVSQFDQGEMPGALREQHVDYLMKLFPSESDIQKISGIAWWEPVMSYSHYVVWKFSLEPHAPAKTRSSRKSRTVKTKRSSVATNEATEQRHNAQFMRVVDSRARPHIIYV